MKEYFLILGLICFGLPCMAGSLSLSGETQQYKTDFAEQLSDSSLVDMNDDLGPKLKEGLCIEDVTILCKKTINEDIGINNPLMDFTLIPFRFRRYIALYCDINFDINAEENQRNQTLTLMAKSQVKKGFFEFESTEVSNAVDKITSDDYYVKSLKDLIKNSSCSHSGEIRLESTRPQIQENESKAAPSINEVFSVLEKQVLIGLKKSKKLKFGYYRDDFKTFTLIEDSIVISRPEDPFTLFYGTESTNRAFEYHVDLERDGVIFRLNGYVRVSSERDILTQEYEFLVKFGSYSFYRIDDESERDDKGYLYLSWPSYKKGNNHTFKHSF